MNTYHVLLERIHYHSLFTNLLLLSHRFLPRGPTSYIRLEMGLPSNYLDLSLEKVVESPVEDTERGKGG